MIDLLFCSLLSHSLDPSPRLLNPSQNPPLPPPPPPLSSTLTPLPPSPTPVVAVFAATSRKNESSQPTSLHSSGHSGDNEEVTNQSRSSKRKQSIVWEHFTKKDAYPHDGETLFSFMKEMILEWNLDKKLFSIVVDNATNNDVMIRKVKDWILYDLLVARDVDLLHVRCSAHILNLIVQDGLNEIRGLIDKIRETVRYLNKSPAASQKFEMALSQCNLTDKRQVAMDVPNRWNSTYELLATALPLKEAFSRLQRIDKNYHCNPSESEWDVAGVVHECLQIFYEATHHFSGRKIYDTEAHLYIQRVRDKLVNLFIDYGGSCAISVNESNVISSSGVETRASLRDFDRWCYESRVSNNQKSELESYLEEARFPRAETFNILDWWKTNSPRLLVLAKIARDILAVPANTVASEAAFSDGGRIIDESRTCLLPDAVEALVVADDWIESIPKRSGVTKAQLLQTVEEERE
ncbi:UNVERIFIED_CONTAM: putative AC transposase [Sesamum calycinum]|uniref:AC transposase n=1 Tax=Sesamum calycinum TaxID=2727403 RepID=A0AAW2LTY9_9LAMI